MKLTDFYLWNVTLLFIILRETFREKSDGVKLNTRGIWQRKFLVTITEFIIPTLSVVGRIEIYNTK